MQALYMSGLGPGTSPYRFIDDNVNLIESVKETETKSVNKFAPCGVFLRVQYWC